MARRTLIRFAPLLLACSATGAGAEGISAPDWQGVRAVFEKRCFNCHSRLGAAKGLRLDSYGAAITGSVDGAVLVSGDVDRSELMRRLRGQSKPRMPFLSTPLTEAEIALIARWIAAGLPNAAGLD